MGDAEPRCDPPVLLDPSHDASTFDSGEDVLDDWLRRRAWNNQKIAASRTYVACPVGTRVVAGCFALSVGQIIAHDVTAAIRRNMPRSCPTVTLGHLAVERDRQRRGLGRAVLSDAVRRSLRAAEEISARLVVVHALTPAAEAFDLRHGFARMPVETPTLALDLVKGRKLDGSR